MSSRSGSGIVYLMPILFTMLFWCLVLPCWSEQLEVGDTTRCPNSLNKSSNTVLVNNTAVDESKLYLKFCVAYNCERGTCYCCENQKPARLCYYDRNDCWAVCPTCNPECPPETTMQGRLSRAVINV
ncbi:hypothetical protein ACP70R_046588 [Stipagrostis hirtigluma subsp. patula]